MVGARFGERGDERVGRGDHQVHVERQRGMRAQGRQNLGTEADVGHELPVHDVEMQPVGARFGHRRDFFAQSPEIRRQQAWRDDESA